MKFSSKVLFLELTKGAYFWKAFDWYLMKRAVNCLNAQINDILFKYNTLDFEFAKSKSFQKDKKYAGSWHLYTNPVLSLPPY